MEGKEGLKQGKFPLIILALHVWRPFCFLFCLVAFGLPPQCCLSTTRRGVLELQHSVSVTELNRIK